MKKCNTIGLDMGDRKHSICILDSDGEVVSRGVVGNTPSAIRKAFNDKKPTLVAMEAGTHSAWVSSLLIEMGHEVLVGNPRKLRAIWESDRKSDVRDAEMLARIARLDPQLLYPIRHRGRKAQRDLVSIRSRDLLVKARREMVCHVRSIAKTLGERVGSCSTKCFVRRAHEELSGDLQEMLSPVLVAIEELDRQILEYDRKIEELSTHDYPETAALRAVSGVGPVTALAFVLTLEDPERFQKSRDVGPFLGLVPRRDQSGQTDKQLPITKAGNVVVRRLLVNCAQYILGAFGPDCELRDFGLRIAAQGGKNAKRRAVVAVARKLAVLLHRLWVHPEVAYDPFYGRNRKKESLKAA
jgi:transposase